VLGNESRSEPRGLADLLLPYALVSDGILLQNDGSLLAGWSFQGPDMMAASPAEMSALSARLNQSLRLGSGWMIHCDAIRSQAPGYPQQGEFLDPVTQIIDEERRQQFLQEGAHYDSEYFLTLTYLPPIEAEERAKAGFSRAERLGLQLARQSEFWIISDRGSTASRMSSARCSKRSGLEPPAIRMTSVRLLPSIRCWRT
jgi:type IV secretory pathway VirB4 component